MRLTSNRHDITTRLLLFTEMLFYILSFTFHIANFVHSMSDARTHMYMSISVASVVRELMVVLLSRGATLRTKLR